MYKQKFVTSFNYCAIKDLFDSLHEENIKRFRNIKIKYVVNIEETINQEIEIEASSFTEAFEIAHQKNTKMEILS